MAAGHAATGGPPVLGAKNDVTLALKCMTALALFVESALGVAIPLMLRNMQSGNRWLALLNCFSGGIFLAAGLVHLLPHCAEAQARLYPNEEGEPSPLYLIAITLGYLGVLYVERVLFDVHADGHGHGHSHASNSDSGTQLMEQPSGIDDGAVTTSTTGNLTSSRQRTVARRTGDLLKPLINVGISEGGARPADGFVEQHQQAQQGHVCTQPAQVVDCAKPARLAAAMPLLLAMSVHTFLECMALGLMSDARAFYVLLGAIAAHKLMSALALSARFLKEGASARQVVLYVGPFACVAPSAILVGSFVSEVNPLAHLLLSCFATGTFLYVGASEVIVEAFEERDTRQGRHTKFAALLAGVALIAAAALMPEGHEHGVAGHHHHLHH